MKEYTLQPKDAGFLPQRDAVVGDYIQSSDTIVICSCGAVMRKSSFKANDEKCPECGKKKLVDINESVIKGFNETTIQPRRQGTNVSLPPRRSVVKINQSSDSNTASLNSVNIGNRRRQVQPSTSTNITTCENPINKQQQQRYLNGYDVLPQRRESRSYLARILLFLVVALLFAIGFGVYTYFETGSVYGLCVNPILNNNLHIVTAIVPFIL